MEKEKNSQLKMVLKHLEKYGCISSYDAFNRYGITRLSAIIYILRHKYFMNIESKNITTKNRYGNVCNYVNYIIVEEGN